MKQKKNRGITLIALIITIIVLLILAVVAISAVSGNGILNHAQNAKAKYSGAQTNEQERLGEYSDYLDEESSKINGGGTIAKVLKNNLNTVLSTTDNTPLTDEYGNKIMLPAGFKIVVDSTTGYTTDTIDVTKGIVVEDTQAETAGNQFVWIPVGKIYTDIEKTEANAKTITLGRYENFTKNEDGTYTVAQNASDYEKQVKINSYYTEDTAASHISNYKNSIAKNIGDFCTKANSHGGYYIGRYEARAGTTERNSETDTLTPVTLKANDYVYNYVTQLQASERCQSMYNNKPYESDLVNSYAWDTAIVFIQEFENSTYSQAEGLASDNNLSNTGLSILKATGKVDKQCNIYDMTGNCGELSTETYNGDTFRGSCTSRGGFADSNDWVSSRGGSNTTFAYEDYSFRPILYM